MCTSSHLQVYTIYMLSLSASIKQKIQAQKPFMHICINGLVYKQRCTYRPARVTKEPGSLHAVV